MAYRGFRYNAEHAIRRAGVGALTLETGTLVAGDVDELADDRGRSLVEFDASGGGLLELEVDLGVDASAHPVNRLLIPTGHNLSVASQLRVLGNAVPGPGGTPLLTLPQPNLPLATGQVVHGEFLVTSAVRYLRLELTTAASARVELGEVIYSLIVHPDPAEAVQVPEYRDEIAPGIRKRAYPSGVTAVLQSGPPRRRFAPRHKWLAGATLAAFDGMLEACGYGASPLFVDPPDDPTEIPIAQPVWCELTGTARRDQDHPEPGGATLTEAPSFGFRLELEEWLA